MNENNKIVYNHESNMHKDIECLASGSIDFSSDSGSEISEAECIQNPNTLLWAQRHIHMKTDPKIILEKLMPEKIEFLTHIDNSILWEIIMDLLRGPISFQMREKLNYVNTLEDVVNLIKKCSNILVLTGAGVSVSCGIPDFRSKNGIYSKLRIDFPDLPDPQAVLDKTYFLKDAKPFFKFAKEIFPGQLKPSISHRFIRLLEHHGKLLRNYTQNIDTLEKQADIQRVIYCHGSFATATCMKCGFCVNAEIIKDDIQLQRIPFCSKCTKILSLNDQHNVLPILKPDIVLFGEGLPDEFHEAITEDKDKCDLLIVIGSSLKVQPVSFIPYAVPMSVPQILINKELLPHLKFDVELLGDCDMIISELCYRLGAGWEDLSSKEPLQEITDLSKLQTNSDETGLTLQNVNMNGKFIQHKINQYIFPGSEF